ncbi:MAG: YggT family protein [Limnohabitans sp.]
MLTQISLFLLNTAISLWVGLFLFRWYCLLIRLNLSQSSNQLNQFVCKLTDWGVLPLRRILPKTSRFDIACFTSAFLVQFMGNLLLTIILTGSFSTQQTLVVAIFELVSSALSGITGLLIVFGILSWVNVNSEIVYLLDKLTQPFLSPVRKFVPMIAGIDISLLIALLLLQLVNIVLINLRLMILLWTG